MRRRLKELWRKDLQHSIPVMDVLFRARKESYVASMAELRADVLEWSSAVAYDHKPRPSGRGDLQ